MSELPNAVPMKQIIGTIDSMTPAERKNPKSSFDAAANRASRSAESSRLDLRN